MIQFTEDSTEQSTVQGNDLVVNGKTLKVLSQKDPAALPWKDLGVYLSC